MKRLKQVIAIILCLTFVFAIEIPGVSTTEPVSAAETFTITSPKAGELRAAGHIDINWSSAASQGTVKNYKLYVDGSLVKTTTGLTYEYYTTKVNYHTAFVVAEFSDGVKISTPSVKFGVTKKGLCVNDTMGRYLDPVAMNTAWYYTWGATPFSYTTYSQREFVPMIWGTGNESSIPMVASKGYKYLLAYNEPDMGANVGGSNINVNTAVSHWSKFLGYNYYLGAPAPALSPSWGKDGTKDQGGIWFRTFMKNIDQSTIDFIPLHCYYSNWGGAAAANAFLTEVVDATWEMYHKPIWITEFAISGWGYSNTTAKSEVAKFMKIALEGLDSRDYVVRYSWFSFDTTDGSNGASALWTNSTGTLTDLGKSYVSYGNPTTNYVAGKAVNNYPHTKPQTPVVSVTKPGKVKIKSAKNTKGRKIKISLKII